MSNNLKAFFQKLARAFLIPVSLIGVASLIMAIGCIFTDSAIIAIIPFFGNTAIQYFGNFLVTTGVQVLHNLALVYAMALAFGLAKEKKEYAALGAFIGYFALLKSMNLLITNFPAVRAMFPESGITTVLGVETINVGIMGGILVGIIVALLANKFKDVKLPMAFSFYQGARFIPIISLIVLSLVGQILPFLWVFVQKAIDTLANVIGGMGIFGPFVYALGERALIPTGLHQIWNTIIRNTAVSGVYEFASGTVVEGCVAGYAQYLAEGLPTNTSLRELVAFYFGPQIPMMLGGLPAIALAIYHCADDDKRESIKPLVLAGALTAIFAAISEPVEFIFLFAAPLLYVVYSLYTGLSWLLCYILGSGVGGSNSSIIGLIVNGFLRPGSNWWVVCVITVLEFILCYFTFRWWIIKFDVKTPGRGGDYDDSLAFAAEIAQVDMKKGKTEELDLTNPEMLKAQLIVKGLGGKDNIEETEACMSRLRVVVKDYTLVDEAILKKTGCNGIVKVSDIEVQIVYGTAVTLIKKTVDKVIAAS